MEHTTLGASGLQVSRACLGPMMFGHGPDAPTSEPDSRRPPARLRHPGQRDDGHAARVRPVREGPLPGCSNWSGSQIVEAQWAARDIGGTPFISLQPRYSLNARQIEDDILPACQRQGLGTMIHSPLGGGVLTTRMTS
jgi:aryl-alcohol dehydrogenase-like predicted oxidoreductase